MVFAKALTNFENKEYPFWRAEKSNNLNSLHEKFEWCPSLDPTKWRIHKDLQCLNRIPYERASCFRNSSDCLKSNDLNQKWHHMAYWIPTQDQLFWWHNAVHTLWWNGLCWRSNQHALVLPVIAWRLQVFARIRHCLEARADTEDRPCYSHVPPASAKTIQVPLATAERL